jgi:hypothetical protein
MTTIQHAFVNWKSTVSGLLSFVIATGAVITAIPNHIVSSKVSGIATIAVGLAKAWVGLIATDAGVVAAITRDGGAPVAMPSTEVPLQPGAVVVPQSDSTGAST